MIELIIILILDLFQLISSLSDSIFVNYHITHHAGTSIFRLAKESFLNYDGMNGIYNIEDQHLYFHHTLNSEQYQFYNKSQTKQGVFNA